jgi:hypothetical protein
MKLHLLLALSVAQISEASVPANYIPPQAFQYFDTIKKEQEYLLPGFNYPEYFAGLIEHESCITLTHKKCWSPTSKLQTSRELGAGVLQITKTYNKDGSVRFDALSDLRKANLDELHDLSWANVFTRPDLQIRAGVIMTRDNYKALYMVTDPYERLAMADSAYNGGLGGVKKQRQICSLKANCDPQKWFNNLDKIVVKSTKAMYAGRSADAINKGHVSDVLLHRMPKYMGYF